MAALLLAARHASARWGWNTGLATWVLGAEDRTAGGDRLLDWDADQAREVQIDTRLGELYGRELMLCETQSALDNRAMTCSIAVQRR